MDMLPQDFNSHAHVERDHFASGLTNEQLNFNSHAHVERDISADVKTVNNFISTHTLTWSVTKNGTRKRKILQISTHTLTWSVTLAKPKTIKGIEISTHTLTWSVTTLRTLNNFILIFQLTRSRGA